MNTYWTFEQYDGAWFDAEFDSAEKAEKFADNLFAEQCEQGGLHTCEANSKLIRFSYDDELEMVIHDMQPLVLSYEREPEYERTYG
jgi:hypothetical protein